MRWFVEEDGFCLFSLCTYVVLDVSFPIEYWEFNISQNTGQHNSFSWRDLEGEMTRSCRRNLYLSPGAHLAIRMGNIQSASSLLKSLAIKWSKWTTMKRREAKLKNTTTIASQKVWKLNANYTSVSMSEKWWGRRSWGAPCRLPGPGVFENVLGDYTFRGHRNGASCGRIM